VSELIGRVDKHYVAACLTILGAGSDKYGVNVDIVTIDSPIHSIVLESKGNFKTIPDIVGSSNLLYASCAQIEGGPTQMSLALTFDDLDTKAV